MLGVNHAIPVPLQNHRPQLTIGYMGMTEALLLHTSDNLMITNRNDSKRVAIKPEVIIYQDCTKVSSKIQRITPYNRLCPTEESRLASEYVANKSYSYFRFAGGSVSFWTSVNVAKYIEQLNFVSFMILNTLTSKKISITCHASPS
jgi:hypothetical protein